MTAGTKLGSIRGRPMVALVPPVPAPVRGPLRVRELVHVVAVGRGSDVRVITATNGNPRSCAKYASETAVLPLEASTTVRGFVLEVKLDTPVLRERH